VSVKGPRLPVLFNLPVTLTNWLERWA